MNIVRHSVVARFAPVMIFAFVSSTMHANLVLNGDFEDNTAGGTIINMTNPAFGTTVANTTAFGTSDELDIWYGGAQSGSYSVGLHQNTLAPDRVDAFSFNLSQSVLSGTEYMLRFYAKDSEGPVQVGLSTSATDFGTQIFAGTAASYSAWTEFDYTFVASQDASFLTVRNGLVPGMYVYVDNFSLTPIPEPSTVSLAVISILGLAGLRRQGNPAL